jgi:signal transduction histidine kinase
MGIRRRLIILTCLVVIPLQALGLFSLWSLWQNSKKNLENSLEERAELAAIAYDRWLETQLEVLKVVGQHHSSEAENRNGELEPLGDKPHWFDVRITDRAGNSIASFPRESPEIPKNLTHEIVEGLNRNSQPLVLADWYTNKPVAPLLLIATLMSDNRLAIARIKQEGIRQLFGGIELPQGVVIGVFDSKNRIIFRSAHPMVHMATADTDTTPVFSTFEGKTAILEARSPYDGVERVYGVARAQTSNSIVRMGVPRTILHEPALKQMEFYLFIGFLTLLFAVTAAYMSSRSIVAPLQRLRDTAQKFGAGQLDTRINIEGTSELVELSSTFNKMAEQIQERERRLTELDRLKSDFVSSVSHEMRTPLTTIKTLTRVLMKDGHSELEKREYLETIASECDRQIDLVLNLLDLSKIESGSFKLKLEAVDVVNVINACQRSTRRSVEAAQQRLEVGLIKNLPLVKADSSALRRVLMNLIENSIKYNPSGGTISIDVYKNPGYVTIKLSDTGYGIFPDDTPYIFEKFFRGRPVRVPKNLEPSSADDELMEVPGVGLGLYIAKTLVDQMGGSITVESRVGIGTTFFINLEIFGTEEG